MKNALFTIIALLIFAVSQTALAAISAVVSVSPSSATINQPVTANVAISNTGSAINLSSLKITANYNGNPLSRVPAAFSVMNLGPNAPVVSLAANATTTIPFKAVFFAPSTGVTGSGSGEYYIGAIFQTADGSNYAASTAGEVTVDPIASLIED